MATVYSTLAASQLKPITPHVAGFRARNVVPSVSAGPRLLFKSAFPGEQVSKRKYMPLIERRNRCVCAPRASLDEYAPLTAAVYGASLLGGGLFACKWFFNASLYSNGICPSRSPHLLNLLLPLFILYFLRALLSHVLSFFLSF